MNPYFISYMEFVLYMISILVAFYLPIIVFIRTYNRLTGREELNG